jgi:hypothetical protein
MILNKINSYLEIVYLLLNIFYINMHLKNNLNIYYLYLK